MTKNWCGTPNGYPVHIKRHEVPCQLCLDVRRDFMRHRRFRLGFQHDPTRCTACGSVFVNHLCGLTI